MFGVYVGLVLHVLSAAFAAATSVQGFDGAAMSFVQYLYELAK